MAQRSLFATAAACLLSFGFAQSGGAPAPTDADAVYPLRTLDQHVFRAGEKLSYVLHYGWLNAGIATLELKEADRKIDGREVLHAVGVGQSTGAGTWIPGRMSGPVL